MVLWMIRLICSVPMTTPVIPPMKPKVTSEMNMPEKTGLSQGALRSHSNRPLLKPLRALCHLDRTGYRQAVDHAGQHRQVHGVTGVEHLPFGADARVHQDVVGAGQLQEQDVEQEGDAADLLRHRTGAEHQAGDQVPDATRGPRR